MFLLPAIMSSVVRPHNAFSLLAILAFQIPRDYSTKEEKLPKSDNGLDSRGTSDLITSGRLRFWSNKNKLFPSDFIFCLDLKLLQSRSRWVFKFLLEIWIPWKTSFNSRVYIFYWPIRVNPCCYFNRSAAPCLSICLKCNAVTTMNSLRIHWQRPPAQTIIMKFGLKVLCRHTEQWMCNDLFHIRLKLNGHSGECLQLLYIKTFSTFLCQLKCFRKRND